MATRSMHAPPRGGDSASQKASVGIKHSFRNLANSIASEQVTQVQNAIDYDLITHHIQLVGFVSAVSVL